MFASFIGVCIFLSEGPDMQRGRSVYKFWYTGNRHLRNLVCTTAGLNFQEFESLNLSAGTSCLKHPL